MKKPIYILLIIFLVGCNSTHDKKLVSGILKENMDFSVIPGDNFNAYVNGTWIKNTQIPADKSSYSIGTIVHEESEEHVKKIIEQSAHGDFEEGSNEQKLGYLFNSFIKNRCSLIDFPVQINT